MRKFLVMTSALFAFGVAGAQEAVAQQNMAGVKGGFVSSSVSSVELEDLDRRSSVGVGAFLQVAVAPNVSIQPEALFLMKGADDDATDQTRELDYLQVPMLVQYHIPAVGVSPRIFAGPSLAFETGCNVSNGDESVPCETFGIDTKSADFGLVFGGGVDIPAGGFVVTLDGRYDLSVTNVADEEGVEVKNRSVQLFAGVGFPFGP
ncbi:MAG: porin family protein [Gemmatimonadota bacterium]